MMDETVSGSHSLNSSPSVGVGVFSTTFKNGCHTVQLESGSGAHKNVVEVSLQEVNLRTKRKGKDRRGKRWLRGRLNINYEDLCTSCPREKRSGTVMLADPLPFSSHTDNGRPSRGKPGADRRNTTESSAKGLPLDYASLTNRLYDSLSVPNQCPFSDYEANAFAIRDDDNKLPLSNLGLSTALVDLGYTQKDFMVAAKAVINGEDIKVSPTDQKELSTRIDLEHLEEGQGVIMVEYFALSNKVAHVFTKGQVSVDIYRKGLALCVHSCEKLADSALSLLREKYDSTVRSQMISHKAGRLEPATPAVNAAQPQSEQLKASFSQMLSGTSAAFSNRKTDLDGGKPALSSANKPLQKAPLSGKKLTLADLAKRKKT